MKKYFYLSIILIISSCNGQTIDVLNLNNIPNNFNANTFVRNQINEDEKNDDLESFSKDTLAFFNSERAYPLEQYLSITSVWSVRNKVPNEIFGYKYRILHWQEKDTIAVFDDITFPYMNISVDTKNNLVNIEVEKTSKNENDYIKIKKYFERNCKNINIKEFDTPSYLEKSYWENKNYFFILTKRNKKQKDVVDKTTSIVNLNIEIFSKKFIEQMKKNNVYSSGYCFYKKKIN